jgi:surface-anchored protein
MALEAVVGHVELEPHYSTINSTWNWQTYWFDNDLNLRTDPVNALYFPGFDNSTANFGVKVIRPAASKWDFLGVAAGEPVWIFTDTRYASAGFASTQNDLSGNLTFSLDGVSSPNGGYFSMYSGTTPDVHMKTIDGIGTADLFSKPLQHTHVNWAFSKKGLWIVKLKVQGTVKSTGLPTPVSPPQPIVFAIGGLAMWKASRFSMAELQNAAVSGDSADPDGDGWSNLMEYALGGDCRTSSTLREDDTLALAPKLIPPTASGAPWKFRYYRRLAGKNIDVTYQVQSSGTLAPQSWTTESGTEGILSSDADWELVSVTLGTGSPRFFRLMVTSIP